MEPEELVCGAKTILFWLSGSFVRVCVCVLEGVREGGAVIAAATTPPPQSRLGELEESFHL